MHAGQNFLVRTASLAVLALAWFGCAESQMTLLDEELNKYRYEQEQYRRESLEELYYEESMRCEDLTIEILDLRRQIEEKTVQLDGLKARLAELQAQAAEAGRQLAATEQSAPAATPPAEKPAPSPDAPQKSPEESPEMPPDKQ
jgi:septal ring factor EnvC (AmiA/AmiB activator)